MKNAREILQHIVKTPTFEPLRRKTLINNFIYILPLSIRQAILFNYERDGTLFFALNHPAFLKEFNYKLPLIKSLLIKAQNSALHELSDIKDVKAFVSRQVSIKQEENAEENRYRYKEHSHGSFKNLAQDRDIAEHLEEIRQIINRNIALSELDDEEGFYARQLL
ncbi:MAG: hypothetical protein ACTTJS_07695 [Wolinella sp.]